MERLRAVGVAMMSMRGRCTRGDDSYAIDETVAVDSLVKSLSTSQVGQRRGWVDWLGERVDSLVNCSTRRLGRPVHQLASFMTGPEHMHDVLCIHKK